MVSAIDSDDDEEYIMSSFAVAKRLWCASSKSESAIITRARMLAGASLDRKH